MEICKIGDMLGERLQQWEENSWCEVSRLALKGKKAVLWEKAAASLDVMRITAT